MSWEPTESVYPNEVWRQLGEETSAVRSIEIYDQTKSVYNSTFPKDAVDELRVFR